MMAPAIDNPADHRTGGSITIKDSSGTQIVGLARLTWDWSGTGSSGSDYVAAIGGSTAYLATDLWPSVAKIDALTNSWKPLRIIGYNGNLLVKWGTASATVIPGGTWSAPKTLAIRCGQSTTDASSGGGWEYNGGFWFTNNVMFNAQ